MFASQGLCVVSRRLAVLAAGAFLLSLGLQAALADTKPKKTPRTAKKQAAERGQEAKNRPASDKPASGKLEELYGVAWYTSWEDALKEAASPSKEKPVMCLRVLGDLNGFM
jgi:hypothetical protein